MSNQEPHNQGETKEAGVEKRRQFLKGAGIAAPVILTLSSPSVFGAFCRSEIMSGNESHMGAGSCVLGESRNYWKNPNSSEEWTLLGFNYGVSTATPPAQPSTTDCSAYTGGTAFKDVFGGSNTQTMRCILFAGTSPESYYVAAYLNAKKYPNYILNFGDVIDLWNNHAPSPAGNLPPGYATDVDFLASTLKTAP